MKHSLKLLSLNINGISSKLENRFVIDLFQQYDVIYLSELKCVYPFAVPGFKCIRSQVVKGEESRGGVAVLFKLDVWPYVYDVKCLHDQVWYKLKISPGVKYGAVYIAPTNSPYFTPQSFASMHSQCKDRDHRYLVMGDINARIKDLSQFCDKNYAIQYIPNNDNGLNANGNSLCEICKNCDIVPVNNLIYEQKTFHGGLTYRQKDNWVTQLDWALVSKSAIKHVHSFKILNDIVLPTNHAPVEITIGGFYTPASDLLERAKQLGVSYPKETNIPMCRRTIQMYNLDSNKFKEHLPPTDTLWDVNQDVANLCDVITETLYNTAVKSKMDVKQPMSVKSKHENAQSRWNYLVQHGDSRQIWQSINWHGEFDNPGDISSRPSDLEFCDHYEHLLNPNPETITEYVSEQPKYIPVLDDPISPGEVDDCIKTLKQNKAAGHDGIPPGVLKLLNIDWICIITLLFNIVFRGLYPFQWALSKVFNIFKKGDRMDTGNYRGISILVALAKLYDMVLSKRFSLWFKPMVEQAGSQKGRGCEEQILSVRLLIDIARKCKHTLYISFIDYQKAYDKVNREKLLKLLDQKGCGSTFLQALAASMSQSSGIIGSEMFRTTAGVRQGASTSCPLFTFFIEETIKAVSSAGTDGWLGDTHILLLMDDTVILATSRDKMQEKLDLLKSSVDEIGMIIHPKKSRFLCINGTSNETFHLGDAQILYTDTYTYLGTPISNKPINKQMENHIQSKVGHTFKFSSFLNKNSDAPFIVKRTVWESALQSALYYSSETWLTTNLRAAETVYMSTLKQLIGVRQATCNELVLTELGICSAKAYILQKQCKFIHKLTKRVDYANSYIEKIVAMAIDSKCPAGKCLKTLLEKGPNHDYVKESLHHLKTLIGNSDSSRRMVYKQINPELTVYNIYEKGSKVPEHQRLACSRLRLSSHRLRIETGRWARLPIEERTLFVVRFKQRNIYVRS